MSDVLLPDIGDFHDVEIIEILVKHGDRVEPEDPLITLESDKASMEIPSPRAGVVAEVKVALGDKLNQGDLILTLEDDAGDEADEVNKGETENKEAAKRETAPAAESSAQTDQAPAQTPAASIAGEAAVRDVRLPDIGDFRDVEIIEMLVAVGDSVEAEQSLLTLESDKATMEIPAPFGGVVKSLDVKLGDKVNKGDLIATVETTAVAATDEPRPALEAEPVRAAGEKEPLPPPVMTRPSDTRRTTPHASPGVRRFARELGVDLALVSGSGPKTRITREDVQAFVKRSLGAGAPVASPAAGAAMALPAMPGVDFTKFGEIEERALGRIRKLSGAHLHRSWLHVPHVTQFDEADITELEAFRKSQKDAATKADVKLTFMPFLLQAVCKALAVYPQFNSSLSPDGDTLILKKYTHIGVAVDTPDGLVVPVIRDVDKKGLFELAGELGDMSARARESKLAPGDMQGGCLSISSLGGIGGTQFTPIVNAPEVAVLGVSRAEMRPKWGDGAFEPRLIMPFSLSYDHRVIDGAEGVRFTRYLGELLSDIRRLLL